MPAESGINVKSDKYNSRQINKDVALRSYQRYLHQNVSKKEGDAEPRKN
jgi:hypothetical protein